MYFLPLHQRFLKIHFNMIFCLIPPSTLSNRAYAIRILLVGSVCPVQFICIFFNRCKNIRRIVQITICSIYDFLFILCFSHTLSLYRHSWSSLHGLRDRAGPRNVDTPCRLVIWGPFKPIFPNLFRPTTGLINLSVRAREQHVACATLLYCPRKRCEWENVF